MVKKAKHPGGAPTKYKAGFCDITPYIAHCESQKELPSICGYAVYFDVCEQTVVNWGKKHKEFLVSLGKILTLQKQTLFNKGLTGDYNSTIAKLLLSANHKVHETSGIAGPDGGPIPLTIVNFSKDK